MKYLLPMSVLFSAAVFAAEPTPAPLPPEEAAAGMRLPQGFRSTLVAAEPDVVQPISYCFDDRGRLFVAEALNYGEWQPTGKDRIVILEDTNADGRFDSRKVFFEGLNYVTGLEVGFGGGVFMSPPKLSFISDRDGDDRPDGEPQTLFDGFGYQESRHNLTYWRYGDYAGVGPGAHGRRLGMRTQRHKKPENFLSAIRRHGNGIVEDTHRVIEFDLLRNRRCLDPTMKDWQRSGQNPTDVAKIQALSLGRRVATQRQTHVLSNLPAKHWNAAGQRNQ